MWQILDVDLLKTHLTQSIFYLHSQPPLLNLSLGLVLKLTPDQIHAKQLLLSCFRAMGLSLVLMTFQLMLDLGVPIAIALVLTLLFEFNPGTLMLENWFYTTYPTEVLLSASAFLLNRFISQGKKLYGVSFLICTALPIFLNSSFQPLWFIGVLAFSYYYFRERTRELLPATLVVLGLIASLLIKNAIAFGVVTTSSWFGMNLARMTTTQLPARERQEEIRAGKLSEFAMIPEFSDLDSYPMVPSEPTGIPVLDQRFKRNGDSNFNNISYVEISRRYLSDALGSLFHHPRTYFRSMLRASGCYLGALKDQDQFVRQRARLGGWNDTYDLMLQPVNFSWWPRHQDCPSMSLTLLTGLPLILVVGLIRLARAAEWNSSELTIAFVLMTIAYTTATGVMFEIGENARFRSVIDPLALVLFGSLIADLSRYLSQMSAEADSDKRSHRAGRRFLPNEAK